MHKDHKEVTLRDIDANPLKYQHSSWPHRKRWTSYPSDEHCSRRCVKKLFPIGVRKGIVLDSIVVGLVAWRGDDADVICSTSRRRMPGTPWRVLLLRSPWYGEEFSAHVSASGHCDFFVRVMAIVVIKLWYASCNFIKVIVPDISTPAKAERCL